MEQKLPSWNICYGTGQTAMAHHLFCPAVSKSNAIRYRNSIEREMRHLIQKSMNGPHTASLTIDDIRNEATSVFRNIRLPGVRRSLRWETRRLMYSMGKIQVYWISKTTIDVSKWTQLHWKRPEFLNTYIQRRNSLRNG